MRPRLKIYVKATAVFLVGLLFSCTPNRYHDKQDDARIHHLVVLHTNDTHGHPVKFFYHPAPDVGGLPARATVVNRIREEHGNVLLLDGGDLNTGRSESNLFKARPDLEGYNYIGYDAIVIGNHEFDNPISVLREQMKLANFPFISANIRAKGGAYLAEPFIIREFAGLKVAIFGLTTKETEVIGNPEYVRDLVFEDEIEVAKNLVPKLRTKADLVIGLVHLGIYDSTSRGSKRLAREVSGIDLIVDGHSHTKLDSPVVVTHPLTGHNTPIVQAWKWGLILGRVDLFVQNKRVIDYRFEAIPINLKEVAKKADGVKPYHSIGEKIAEDPKLLDLLEPYVAKVESVLSKVIGQAEATFFYDGVREEENPLGNLVADSMLWHTKYLGADFALQNGGGIRADLPEGRLTERMIYEALPFDSTVVVLTLDGKSVQSLFEYMATISSGQGGFPQVSEGVSIIIDTSGKQCTHVMINGKPLDTTRTYKIATNSYLAAGGDGYRILLKAMDAYDSSMFQRDVLAEYIEHLGGRIKPQTFGRIQIIGKEGCLELLREAA
ncbi:MAG: 5'-nucleotidase C-terminal domain-containing protein [Deltaproteobacteria bacterium]|nr:MAG: 5'-nucleotidase C-terminal domain-containing protein [Deltaproteobacteria bacterium]